MELDKPLVIHLVKAMSELLKLKQQIKPANPWIIHGFRGKAALAEECLRHGFYLSFGEKYQEEALRITPAGRLFLETDESPCRLRIYIAGQPKPVAYLWRNSRKRYGKISPKSFLNNKSCLFG